MTARSILKQWFSRGKKPTGSQFAEWIDSFWHKGEDTIEISNVHGLQETLNDKSDNGHLHPINDIEGLPEALNDKSDKGHVHPEYITQHQDISGKQDKTDNSLLTTVKTIVGAINELRNKFTDYALANHTHSEYLTHHQDISGKADKVSGATAGNFAALDANGNPTDSGKKAADFATAAQGAKADTALQSHQDISGKQDKTDNSLLTTVKTIVGAINELWNKFTDYALANHTHSEYLTHHQDISGKADKVSGATAGNFAALDVNGNPTDSGKKAADFATAAQGAKADTALQAHQDISGKADKVSGATAGNFAALDANGNPTDSGKKAADFATAAQGAKADTALQAHQDISGKQDKTDNSLLTTVKTIVGAINELWNKFADYLKGIQHVTYAQLVTLRNNSGLVAGQWYRITDYMTTVANDTEARSAGHPFDLLAMATSSNTLSEEAKAIKSSRDSNGYFTDANLNAWKVWYSLDNDTTRFQWADTENGKGVIWRMIDEWQNDCPYDFKNVQFKRYCVYDDSPHGELEALDGQYYGYNGDMNNVHIDDEDDFVWAYTFTLIDENDDYVDYSIKKEGALDTETDWGYLNQFKKGRCEYNRIRHSYTAVTIDDQCYRTLMLNNIVLISTINEECGLPGEMQLNEFGVGNYNMTVKDNPEKNVFGNKCYNNIVGSYANTFGNDVHNNTFGNGCYGNTFGNDVHDNTFGNNCRYNTFGNDVHNNTFGNGCYSNTFGNSFQYNTFGNGCSDNTFGNDCCYNTFGNNCYYNTFGNDVHNNTFGNNCRYITVHNGVQYVEVLGGNTDSAYVQNAQILNGTHGSDSSNRLQISFQQNADYCQYAGLNSSGNLRIWTPADAA